MNNLRNPGKISKSLTGISGFDEISGGGLPKGRITLVCGGAGCGKTNFCLQFLVNGALFHNEPGIFVSFEETPDELRENAQSIGFDLGDLVDRKLLKLLYVRIDEDAVSARNPYDVGKLFIQLADAISSIDAKRIALDTTDSIFQGLSDPRVLRVQLGSLFRWLKNQKVTAVGTAEPGTDTLTREGLEEFLVDCVILLDYRLRDQILTRRLRIVKYRGTQHGADEYPFVIGDNGIVITPATVAKMEGEASTERISTGISELDMMLEGKGFYRGSSNLISGTPGSGKTSLVLSSIHSACMRGEHCLYFSFEETPNHTIRNMRSIGIDLRQWVEKKLLLFHSSRASLYGLEIHIAAIEKTISDYNPSLVVLDPMTNITFAGTVGEARVMLTRLIDFLKRIGITTIFTDLVHEGAPPKTQEEVSSLIDTWIFLAPVKAGGEAHRTLSIIKSRGMANSNEIREFYITDHGILFGDTVIAQTNILTGSERKRYEEQEKHLSEDRGKKLEYKRKLLDAKVTTMRAEFEAEVKQEQFLIQRDKPSETEIKMRESLLEQKHHILEARIAELRTEIGLEEEEKTINEHGGFLH